MARVVVTGGTGFLGRRVVGRLCAVGHDVVVVSRNGPPAVAPAAPASARGGAEPRHVRADLVDATAWPRAAEQIGSADVLVHLAAAVPRRPADDDPWPMIEANVSGTQRVLDSLGRLVRSVVLGSSAEVYGLGPFVGTVSEAEVPIPATHYGASKYAAELLGSVFGRRHDVPVRSLRFTVLYGAGDEIHRALPNFAAAAVASRPPIVHGGDELRDYLAVDEAARAVELAVERPGTGPLNISTGRAVSVLAAAEAVIVAAGSGVAPDVRPRRSPGVDLVFDAARADAALGFRAGTVFPDGLEEVIAWARRH